MLIEHIYDSADRGTSSASKQISEIIMQEQKDLSLFSSKLQHVKT